ncbi:MAG TPA: Sua5/YciO/YrdC/YwlC family protein [Gemmataceae bacterium]|jgi:protein-tyrosine phosphatase|nr:Sua5/YciO/YrdC/YwlC family protein [Gemmataceae bacterium]
MPEVLDWQRMANPRSAVHRAVQALRSGRLVAFPTETVYGIAASALVPEAVERLGRSKARADNKPFTLAIGGADEALDWVPGLGRLGRRLARRCWPGPVTLVCTGGVEGGLAGRLTEGVRQRVCPQAALGLRTPAHEAILQVLRALAGALVLTSANRGGEADAATAEAVLRAVGDHLDLVIDDGPSRYGQASTVVQVNGDSWKLLREGVVPAATLERLSACVIVFVCTGNTCRSPLAEALCKKLLAARLGCPVAELPRRGFVVLSAGLAAMMGGRAAPEAVAAARELDADLAGHSSQPLTQQLAAQADYLVAMTRGHLLALAAQFAGLGNRARLLGGGGEDIPDPIGCDQQVYRECAQQILRYVENFVPELQQS